MNIQKFTQKSVEAINNCEKLAYDYGNQEIEQEHLLVALLQQEEGLIPKLIEKMEIDVQHFTQNAISKLDARVKVSGSNSNVYVGKDLNNVLIHAEDEAKAMGDEYVSVEHIFLAMLKYPNPAMKALMKEYGLTRERFLQALSTVRGNQRVTSDNPEATYDTLEKYGYDMVERARQQKMVFSARLLSAGRLHRIRHILEALRSAGTRSISPCIHSYQDAPCWIHRQTGWQQVLLQVRSCRHRSVPKTGTNQLVWSDL